MSKRKHEDTTPPAPAQSAPTSTQSPDLFTSTPIYDRSSTFTAVFTPSTISPATLQLHPPFSTATHKMLAWRKPSAQRSLTSFSVSTSSSAPSRGQTQNLICETGSDEDGEQYAGKKLEKVLVEMGVVGTVVVARWYGGVLLGPVRFKWIEEAAREAVLMWKRSVGGEGNGEESGGGGGKKVRIHGGLSVAGGDIDGDGGDDDKEKDRLVKVLKERDGSVGVLRGLLAEKNVELRRVEGGEEGGKGGDEEGRKTDPVLVNPPVATVPDYVSMPVVRLRQLEKARDATLSWILKQIDVTEEKIKAKEKEKAGH